MRKLVIILIVLVISGGALAILNNYNNQRADEFSLDDYKREITIFSSDKILGSVPDAKTARKLAVQIWTEIYGSETINGEKPFLVYFDDVNQVWLVTGSLPWGYKGGVAYILIQKEDGKVLADWHEE